jgi:signal transduction histidine kinase
MALRFVLSISADVPLPEQRGTNPTSWVSVFWFIVLISLTAIAVMWLDVNRKHDSDASVETNSGSQSGQGSFFGKYIALLWGAAFILILAIVSELGIAYTSFLENEREQLTRSAQLANEAFVEHTSRVIRETDTLIRAVRSHYLRTQSLTETERFIESLNVDKTFIEDIFIVSGDGMIVLPESARLLRRSTLSRDYFLFHREHSADEIFITQVNRGQITGKNQFRLTRRINNPDGSFAGVVVIPLEPRAFTNYYRSFLTGAENLAVLIGTDRRLRARVPDADDDAWQRQIESPLWAALEKTGIGTYHNHSGVDGIERTFLYRRIPDLPLIIVTAFSDGDANRAALSKLWAIIPAGLFAVVFILALAGMLTIVLRQRDDQDRFMSMLSHELKTPLSVIHMTLGGLTIPADVRARVGRAVGAMTAIIERCLQADRLRHGRVVAVRNDCRIDDVLAAICKGSSAPERCRLQLETLPICATDIQLLTLILTNLVDNALKYSAQDGQVDIAAMSAEERQRPGIRIIVSNVPGASGMPDARHVFRKYYRSAGARSKTGSGLGLHIAEGFARKLGGRLRYQPADGKVKFALWIPL